MVFWAVCEDLWRIISNSFMLPVLIFKVSNVYYNLCKTAVIMPYLDCVAKRALPLLQKNLSDAHFRVTNNCMIAFNNIIEIIFPGRCVVCGSAAELENRFLCGPCCEGVSRLQTPICSCCGNSLFCGREQTESYLCGACLRKKPEFDLARSFFIYKKTVRSLVAGLKYNNDTAVLNGIKELVAACDLREFADCELVLPVPLHGTRLRQRGFNQALHLSRIFFSARRSEIDPFLLTRPIKTVPQTELSGRQRRQNLRNAFAVADPDVVRGKSICLVDDVYTTGTTVNECSRVLRRYSCKTVKVLTLARVNPD